ncbi:MAG: hypothetical protein WBP13_09610 [Methylophilaceae bacterium]
MQLYYQDKRNDLDMWEGLLLSCNSPSKPLMRLQTTQSLHMKLSAGEQALLWAKIEDGYCGVSTLRALPHSEEVNLLPHIRSAELMQARPLQGEAQKQYWAKFYTRALQNTPMSPLYSGLWSMSYIELEHDTNSPRWLARSKAKWCLATAQDQQFLAAHDVYIDWWLSGNGNIINLFAPHADPSHVGRIKWWLKVAREQTLPPLLLWYVSSLDAYVLLDGHDRLQVALINGIAPVCLVLSSYTEQTYPLDEGAQAGILKQLSIVEQKITEGTQVNPDALAGINQALVRAFDNRPWQCCCTRGYANITLAQWEKDTQAFKKTLSRKNPHEPNEQFQLLGS